MIAQTLLLTVFFVAFAHEGRSASGGRQLRFVEVRMNEIDLSRPFVK
ncbi:hypothetical protein [Methyloglobulus morosus]|nr:hypothetical protein [Methyloglobulus morosus]